MLSQQIAKLALRIAAREPAQRGELRGDLAQAVAQWVAAAEVLNAKAHIFATDRGMKTTMQSDLQTLK